MESNRSVFKAYVYAKIQQKLLKSHTFLRIFTFQGYNCVITIKSLAVSPTHLHKSCKRLNSFTALRMEQVKRYFPMEQNDAWMYFFRNFSRSHVSSNRGLKIKFLREDLCPVKKICNC